MSTTSLPNKQGQTYAEQADEDRRYLRYTQILNGIPAVGTTLLAIWILLSPERRSDPEWLFWLLLTMATIHTQEEYLFPSGFVAWFNVVAFGSKNPRSPLSAKRAFYTDGLAAIVVMFILLVFGRRFPPVVFVFAGLLFVNAFFHILETLKTGKYSPGVVTAVLLFLPGIPALAYFYLERDLVSPLGLLAALGVGLLMHAAFFRQVRGWILEPQA